jgi:hypothetical protein
VSTSHLWECFCCFGMSFASSGLASVAPNIWASLAAWVCSLRWASLACSCPMRWAAVWMALQSGFVPAHGLQWVGGAGWKDGLLLTAAITAILGGVLDDTVRRLPKQAFRQVAPTLA